jgi:PadR family transcriptional regulator AphA
MWSQVMPELTSPLSLTDHVVLGLLAEQSRHGFAVARELKPDAAIGQIWTVHRPLVYRAIDHLAGIGLVEPAHTEPGEQGPHRTVYRTTRKGRDRHRRWLERPVEHPREARAELLVKFLFLDRRRKPLTPLARAQLERFGVLTEGLERTTDAASGTDRLIALWRLETLRAINNMLCHIIDDERRAVPARPLALSAR